MRTKIGRNDPCWCGSGKKYKKCHLDRDKAPQMNPFLAEQELNKHFTAKYCIHPEAAKKLCKGGIVRAHTIQRAGGLSRIAEDGHVYGFKPSMKMLIENNGEVFPTLLGINQASTFTGFCGFHDSETFKALERKPFAATGEQCFLLAYRAYSRELFMKRAMSDSTYIHRQFDKGRSLGVQRKIQSLVNLQDKATNKTLAEMIDHKKIFDTSLITKDYNPFLFCVYYLDGVPNTLCSGGFNPLYDVNGTKLQDIYDLESPLDVIYYSLIPTEAGSAAVFSWIPKWGNACLRFMESLKAAPRQEIPNLIIRLSFEYLENVFFSPKWWNTLSPEEKTSIQGRFISGILKERKAYCLSDDKVEYTEASVLDIVTNEPGLR